MSAVLQEPIDLQPERLEIAVEVTPAVRQATASAGALAVAQSYELDCPEVAQSLADERRAWAARIDRLEAMKKDLISPLKKALDDMRERLGKWFDPALADLNAARDLAGQKLLAWDEREKKRIAAENEAREAEARRVRQEAEKRAAEARAKADEEARIAREKAAQAEAARVRAAQEAEQARREGNAKAAAEADRKAKAAAAEVARAAETENAALENGAAKAEALQLEAAAATSAMPTVAATKIAGQSMKDNWIAELNPGVTLDHAKLLIVEAIVTEKRTDLLALLTVDTAPRGPLNKLAAALQKAMNVPGFVARNKPSLAGSRK
jgi:uncharacterized membrane protein YqiK